MGGSDTAINIWFEPHAGKFGSLAKDKVELLLWRKVCVNQTMTLKQAKAAYLTGGRSYFPNVERVRFGNLQSVSANSQKATEDRGSGNDLLHQNSVLNEWFERGGYLCLKFLLPSSNDFRRRIGPRECTPD